MYSKERLYQILGPSVEWLTHPEKVLYKTKGYTKLEVAEYYYEIYDFMQPHISGRPVILKRFVEGWPGIAFFQRNRPAGAPDFIRSVELGVHKKAEYIVLEGLRDLLYLVNIDTLELHMMPVRAPHFYRPGFVIFDLDPPLEEGYKIEDAFRLSVEVALVLSDILKAYGLSPYVKTSGKKGVHIFCPIQPRYSFQHVFGAAFKIAELTIKKVANTTTERRLGKRQGQLLIDVYRNHPMQSVVAPYSTRATEAATVSMPLPWEVLADLTSPMEFTIATVPQWLRAHGDAWQDIDRKRTPIPEALISS